jgi:hypothetical protein
VSTRAVLIVYGGRTVHVEYRPEAIPLDGGRDLERRMHETIDEADRRELHRQALFRVVIGWDLTDPGGEPMSISDKAFDRHVSWFLERLIMQAIIRHHEQNGGLGRRCEPRPCAHCGNPFRPQRRWTKYCTLLCRRRAREERVKTMRREQR